MYTLSIGIKSSHPAKSTAASTAGGCWPTETKQTRWSVQLQSLPLLWRGKGSCETRSYLKHQMKGVFQQWRQRSPCRHRNKSQKVLMGGQCCPMNCQVKVLKGRWLCFSLGLMQHPLNKWKTFHLGQWYLDGPTGVSWPERPSPALSQM